MTASYEGNLSKDLTGSTGVLEAFRAVAVTGAVAGVIVDTQGYESIFITVAVGAMANADNTFTVVFEDGNDDALADAAAVVAADIIGSMPATIDSTLDLGVHRFGYKGNKRYIRYGFSAAAGTGVSAPIAAVAVLGHKRHQQ